MKVRLEEGDRVHFVNTARNNKPHVGTIKGISRLPEPTLVVSGSEENGEVGSEFFVPLDRVYGVTAGSGFKIPTFQVELEV